MCIARIADSQTQGVVFDVDGTLYWQLPVRIAMASLLCLTYCLQPKRLIEVVTIIRAYRSAQEALRRASQSTTEDNQGRQIELTARSTGFPLIRVREVVHEWFERRPLPILRLFRKRGLVALLDGLQNSGLRLGIYSDYPAEKKLTAMGIRDYFTTVVASNDREVRGFKPNSNGFAVAARRMGLEASQIVYIGDRASVDGYGASKAGMKSFIVRNRYKFMLKPSIRAK